MDRLSDGEKLNAIMYLARAVDWLVCDNAKFAEENVVNALAEIRVAASKMKTGQERGESDE